MNEYLKNMSEKIKDQGPQLAKMITEIQHVRYPGLVSLEEVLYPARLELIELYAKTLGMAEENRIEKIREWGESAGTKIAKHYVVTLDMMLREIPLYRNTIGTIIKNEALALEFSPTEVYEVIDRLDIIINDITYYFSVPFARYEKEMLKLSKSVIMELSVPIVAINEETAILPLVGSLDFDRAKVLEERVLVEASELQLENLIIDLSGLQTTDTYVARQLFNLFDALSLLGIQPIVSGITPEIAQTLVQLGLSFGRIKSYATLKQALSSIE